ncbi:hypothetical protein [Streptomyces sp. NRRL S-350]|uniref:hypothetical protein n=1 Tax=Streptomyces sp. NRRL S-350 TaxID=1463902 RepID=UPI00068D6E47|nr:hypothetical protein [Streptomyces sp. NRRL S-350]
MERVPDDDRLDGFRPLLEAGDAVLGYEPTAPEHGFADRCWVLHTLRVDGRRVRWADALAVADRQLADWPFTLSYLLFDDRVRPAAEVEYPQLGAPDRACLARLVEVLARHSADGPETACCFAVAAIEYLSEPVAAHRGRLDEALAHHDADPSGCRFPAHWWPSDRSWFVLTNYDLSATEVFGPPALIADLLTDTELEAVRHPPIAEAVSGRPRWPEPRTERADHPTHE